MRLAALTALVATAALAPAAGAQRPTDDAPVTSVEVRAGTGLTRALEPASLPDRRVDGLLGDWRGKLVNFGGSSFLSRGELVYQDHLFDAYGPDDGRDAQRLAVQDPLAEEIPDTYRIDPALQANLPGEFGLPAPSELEYSSNYGDLDHLDLADLSELRLALSKRRLWLLARTTTMLPPEPLPQGEGKEPKPPPPRTAVLLLIDTDNARGDEQRAVPWGSGTQTQTADYAVFLAGSGGQIADLRSGSVRALPSGSVATNHAGWANAVEAAIPRSLLGDLSKARVAAATGAANDKLDGFRDLGLGANLANVAFRGGEPVRDWWDKQQALSLHDRTIDGFFRKLDARRLAAGASESYEVLPGYHERIFESSGRISEEKGREGVLQHYGVYLPRAYRPGKPLPLQLWLHWRGGTANAAAALAPRIFEDLGEEQGTMVVSPRGRGTSRWYVGKGHQDFREVWADVHRTFPVDEDRTYVAGHSMGGWGSFLMSVLYPDRFAAALPASPPSTQGIWTGVDFEGCDEYEAEGYTPCYGSANDGDPRVQHTRRLLENVRTVPMAIYHGAADELVPVSSVVRQAERLQQLRYRYRLYLFPAQEHYGPPVVDQWADGARYMHRFQRAYSPYRVLYIRDMPFERATERIQSDGVALDFSFNRAFWMSHLEPADPENGQAKVDARSRAIPTGPIVTQPEAGGPVAPGQTGAYVMAGQRWAQAVSPKRSTARNRFLVDISGSTRVRFDLDRMRIESHRRITARVGTDTPLRLELRGAWTRPPRVTVAGKTSRTHPFTGGVLAIELPAGQNTLAIAP
jgi:S-formylglutathione hydrolase FrmB